MALGHWLKDYIGPNSANSGGGTVEVSKIKLATVNGNANDHFFTGGGQMLGTFESLIGDKQIIAIVGEWNDDIKQPQRVIATSAGCFDPNDANNQYSPIFDQNTEGIKSLNMIGITATYYETPSAQPYTMNIYAICI